MGYKVTNVSTGGDIQYGWYQGRKAGVLHQRVAVSDNEEQEDLLVRLPPQCKIVWAVVVNHTAVAVDGNQDTTTSAVTADTYALFNFGTATGPATATASNATTSVIVSVATDNLAASGVTRKGVGQSANDASAVYYNTSTNTNRLSLVPMATNSNIIRPSGTSGLLFNGTANVDVTLYIEEFQDRYVTLPGANA